jgi:hypothetical protein
VDVLHARFAFPRTLTCGAGRIENLERMVQAASTASTAMRTWATRRGLSSGETAHSPYLIGARRFSVSGKPDI